MPIAYGTLNETFKVLGQVNPSATTDTTLYTVPASTEAEVTAITVCNEAAAAGTFRVRIGVAGAAADAKQYIAYDAPISANDTVTFELGLLLAATDVIKVYASSTSMGFQAFGKEIT